MKISAAIDKSEIAKIEGLLTGIKNGSKKAMTKALNKTANTTKTQIAKKLGQTINLKAARIKKDFSVGKATYSNPRTFVKAVGEPVGLVNFAGKQLKKGVKAKVYKKGSAKLLKHAFIAGTKLKGGGKKQHLFWRKKGAWQRQKVNPKRKYHGMIKNPKADKFRTKAGGGSTAMLRLTGPRIEDVLAKDKILKPIEKEAADLLAHNLDVEAAEVLRRAAL